MAIYTPDDIESLLEEGLETAAKKDKLNKLNKSKKEAADYIGFDDDRETPFPKYGYGSRRDDRDNRPISRRSNEDNSSRRANENDRPSSRRSNDSGERGSDHNRRRHDEPPRRHDRAAGDSYRGARARSRSPHQRYSPRGGHYRERSPRRQSGGYDNFHRRGDARGERDSFHNTLPPRRVASPPPQEADNSDARTVFVQQLANRLRTKELMNFFSQVGDVADAHIVKDRVSGRSKGVGYVEFKQEESVPKAINLTGQKLAGIPIIVQLTEAEKNRQARVTDASATTSSATSPNRLYVGNVHFNITAEDLEGIFSQYGTLEFVQLSKEENGRSKGFAFVMYQNAEDAKVALGELNGFELAGRPIRVGLGNDKMNQESALAMMSRESNVDRNTQGSTFSGAGGRGTHAGGSTNYDNQNRDKAAANNGALDDDSSGVNYSNFSREALMKKLARVEEPAAAATKGVPAPSKKPEAATMKPSRCILVKNVYNADEEEGDWEAEIIEDFTTDCSEKCGPVAHVGIPRDHDGGHVYIKFKELAGGDMALKTFQGRLFGGRFLTAAPVVDAIYNMHFPKAASL